jgi:hypothetical protein
MLRCGLSGLALGVVCLMAGCGGGGGGATEKTYPAKGVVTMDGKPFGPVNVALVPSDGKNRPSAAGKVGPDGQFTVTTFKTGDGAPAGNYKILISQDLTNPVSFPAVYTQLDQTPFTVKIETVSGDKVNEINLDLKAGNGPPIRGMGPPGGAPGPAIDPSIAFPGSAPASK